MTLAARTLAALESAQRQLQQAHPGVRVDICAVDLSRTDEQERLAQRAGDADIFVNNAGANPAGDLIDTTDAVWRESFNLKMFGYVNLTRMALGAMKSRGRGVIVNVIGFAGERLMSQYVIGSTANAGLIAFTRTVGSQAPDFGVRVVGVNPAFTSTDRATRILRTLSMKKYGTEERWQEIEAAMNLPFGRMATSEEVADAVLFLASARASYISGIVLNVDGGAACRNG